MKRTSLIAASMLAIVSAAVPASAQVYYGRAIVAPKDATAAPTPMPQTSSPTASPTPTPTASPTPIVQGTWTSGSWGASTSQCSSAATQTRTVSCVVSGAAVADTRCDAASKPAQSQTVENYTGCGTWVMGAYGAFSACNASNIKTQTATATCSTSTCNPATKPADASNSVSCGASCAAPEFRSYVYHDTSIAVSNLGAITTVNGKATATSAQITAAKAFCDKQTNVKYCSIEPQGNNWGVFAVAASGAGVRVNFSDGIYGSVCS